MKEFIDKLIEKLEELKKIEQNRSDDCDEEGYGDAEQIFDDGRSQGRYEQTRKIISIVNELAEEYKDKVMIDGQYCWQTCSATEHCKECNRLCNGSIDYYENYDFMAEEYKGGWIPCSERLPEKAGKYLVTINCGGAVHTSVRRFNPKPKHPKQNEPLFTKHIPLYSGWERRTCGVIAWKDLPAPYQQKEGE